MKTMMNKLVAFLMVVGLCTTGAAWAETVTFETDQGYPSINDTPQSARNIVGHDGWTWFGSAGSDTGWIVDAGPARPANGSVPESQVLRINENTNGIERVFTETDDLSAGTISFILYGGNAGTGNDNFWCALMDSTPTGNADVALQLFFIKDDTQNNATAYFTLKNGTGGVVATSPDVVGITHSTWYDVQIDYDLTDTTEGPYGTYTITVTNLSLTTPTVVWTHSEAISEAVSEIDKFRLGNVVVGGTKTMLDDVSFVPEPATMSLLCIGLIGLLRRKK